MVFTVWQVKSRLYDSDSLCWSKLWCNYTLWFSDIVAIGYFDCCLLVPHHLQFWSTALTMCYTWRKCRRDTKVEHGETLSSHVKVPGYEAKSWKEAHCHVSSFNFVAVKAPLIYSAVCANGRRHTDSHFGRGPRPYIIKTSGKAFEKTTRGSNGKVEILCAAGNEVVGVQLCTTSPEDLLDMVFNNRIIKSTSTFKSKEKWCRGQICISVKAMHQWVIAKRSSTNGWQVTQLTELIIFEENRAFSWCIFMRWFTENSTLKTQV
jgi:hypothetical protein